ncbi:amino acid/polyamine transporter I [Aspergillus bertholletiae]|uniref:Amino acid/polyamine transporter I n=1 Tax=Aspergillus bertholletiae TaxID=1226010 RepID=A0A5N7B7K1_9EURO|nr:amino acid/polyamine transporter I [Aspergillus bertholletiae]
MGTSVKPSLQVRAGDPQPPATNEKSSMANTTQDNLDMQRLGKTQQLKRNFRFLSILGFNCTLMATWESILLTSNYGLINGGRAGMVYVYIGTFIGFFASVASLAEIASRAPTAGGQYHWVSEYAPSSCQRFLSYITGWLSVLGWQAAFASVCFLTGTLIQGLLVTVYSVPTANYTYTFERWHGTLLTIAIAMAATVLNGWGTHWLASLERLLLFIHLVGFFVVLIPLWVKADRASSTEVFQTFTNMGGWPNIGLACLVGQLTPIFSFTGPDAATHMAEEVQDASRIVPWCMISTALVNGALGFVMLITFLYTMGDIDSVLEAPSGFPFITAFQNATGSSNMAVGLACIILVMEVCSALGVLATTSRQMFAFARDKALPFSSTFAYVHPQSKTPIWSILSSTLVTILLSLINIGSTAAFNAIASLAIASMLTTYLIAIACFFMARWQSRTPSTSRFTLGPCGPAINLVSILYLALQIVFTFFPTTRAVEPKTMNWSVLMVGTVTLFAIVQYILYARKVYQAPVSRTLRNQ